MNNKSRKIYYVQHLKNKISSDNYNRIFYLSIQLNENWDDQGAAPASLTSLKTLVSFLMKNNEPIKNNFVFFLDCEGNFSMEEKFISLHFYDNYIEKYEYPYEADPIVYYDKDYDKITMIYNTI